MGGLLIDDAGSLWPAERSTIGNKFADIRVQRNFLPQAIGLGFIFIDICGNGGKVSLHPHFVTTAALARLYNLLARHDPARVMLSVDPCLKSWELIANPINAIKRIEDRVATAQRPAPPPLVATRRLSLDELALDGLGGVWSGRMVTALHAWQAAHGRWDANYLFQRLTNAELLGRSFIVHNAHRSERLVIDHWGADLTLYGRRWPTLARGRDQEDQPNTDVAARFTAMARETILDGLPRLDAIDCVLHNLDGALVRQRCLRFAMPWKATNGDVWLSAVLHWSRATVLERPPN